MHSTIALLSLFLAAMCGVDVLFENTLANCLKGRLVSDLNLGPVEIEGQVLGSSRPSDTILRILSK
jgi:hypothetical protein